ncbi:hypothetical protein [Symmachiella dynata]|uniref:hypothetical protein n=1 Tax=Symmachiella dynata TaxID=2527995 RepID=UPI0030EB538E
MSNNSENRGNAIPWDKVKADGPHYSVDPPIDVEADVDWQPWFRIAWGHLHAVGLTQVRTSLDVTRVRLRAVALCWLAFDYCQASYEVSSDIQWCEWLDAYKIKPGSLAILALTSPPVGDGANDFFSELDDWYEIDDGLEVEEQFHAAEAAFEEWAEILMAALVPSYRTEVINALLKGFQWPSGLMASLHQVITNETEEEVLNGPVYIGDDASIARMRGHDWVEDGCPILHEGNPSVLGFI